MPPESRTVTPHHDHCLGCGPANPAGMGLQFQITGERVRSPLRLDRRHEGAPGFVHGGAVATALDDTIGTLLIVLRRPAVTARLQVDYRRPVFIGTDYVVEAWIDRIDGRKLHLAGAITDTGGDLVAEATALFVEVDMEHFRQSGAEVPEHWRWTPGDMPR